jgi:hypothetical protein
MGERDEIAKKYKLPHVAMLDTVAAIGAIAGRVEVRARRKKSQISNLKSEISDLEILESGAQKRLPIPPKPTRFSLASSES